MHVLAHKGEHFSVRGPLNVARPVQGWPVIVQAGASDAGRQLAAETAEVIFGAARSMADGQEFFADIHRRMEQAGRDPAGMKILPAALVITGETRAEAQDKKALLDSLVHPDSSLPNLAMRLGVDVSGFDLDAELPDLPETNDGKSSQKTLIELARRDHLTVRQLARMVGGYGGLEFVGTPSDDRRRNAGLAGERRLRRVQCHVPHRPGRARRFRQHGHARAAAARAVPPRV